MSTLYSKLKDDWHENFLLYAASAILISTCLGGITAMYILQNGNGAFQLIQLFLVVVVCNLVLGTILTVQKSEYVLRAFITCLIVCFLTGTFNMIF